LAVPASPDSATTAGSSASLAADLARDQPAPGLTRAAFHAMGTTITVVLPEAHAQTGTAAVRALFDEWERCLSRFQPESELSRLNQRAGHATSVSALLFTVLTTALAAAHATNGLYDPALLHTLTRLGYDRTFEALPVVGREPPADAPPPAPPGGWRAIEVDRAARRVTLPAGVGLDFGGIAKGMAVDASLARLRGLGVECALVNAGGDLAVVGQPPGLDAWPIAVEGRDARWTVPLRHGALATSGIARRHWRQGLHERHHLLDPRTGAPAASALWSVTVAADRCEQAEVAAKVAFLLGPERGPAFLRTHQIAGLLVAADGGWTAVDPWPAHLMRPAVDSAADDAASTAPGAHEAAP
jgi:thiamine biosynthesis lipoprotein